MTVFYDYAFTTAEPATSSVGWQIAKRKALLHPSTVTK